MAVAFEWMLGSPFFKFTKEGGEGTIIFKIAWGDIDAFLDEKFPTQFQAGLSVSRPRVDTFPEKPWLQLDTLDVVPLFGEESKAQSGTDVIPIVYQFAKITAVYKTKGLDQGEGSDGTGGDETGGEDNRDDPDVPEGTWVTHRVDVGAEFLTLPTSGLKWKSKNDDNSDFVADDVQPGHLIPTEEHILTWHSVPFPPWDKIRDRVGMVNNDDFLGQKEETVLFMGYGANRDLDTQGNRTWTLEYRFQIKAIKFDVVNPATGRLSDAKIGGWNHFYRPDRSGGGAGGFEWQKIVGRADGNDVYKGTDFSELFTFVFGLG